MNKYQDALEFLCENSKLTQFNISQLQWASETLQELVDKATPKKPNKLTYKLLLDEGWKYECPTCKCAIGINDNASDYMNEDSFCPTCSQAIDWSE